MEETTLTNIKRVLWDESENAPVFVLEDNRIMKPYRSDDGIDGIQLRWAEVKERWEDLDESSAEVESLARAILAFAKKNNCNP